jgi:UTP--glucose-1-phosphate uridylyltransferase
MQIRKAVITAASPRQRTLPLHRLMDCDGVERPVLRILLGHVRHAGIEDTAVVVHPGDEDAYREAAGADFRNITFLPQPEARGYAHAVYCAREFAGGDAFLHMVSDHVYTCPGQSCAREIVELAREEGCAVSAVQPTREALLPQYGTVAGPRITSHTGVYRIDTVIEKPTPTEAEQRLIVAGLRGGYYLCFFGMHVFTAGLFEIIEGMLAGSDGLAGLSDALAELARREQYLALISNGRRYDLGRRYGILTAELALGLHGPNATEVLSRVLEVVALRQPDRAHD